MLCSAPVEVVGVAVVITVVVAVIVTVDGDSADPTSPEQLESKAAVTVRADARTTRLNMEEAYAAYPELEASLVPGQLREQGGCGWQARGSQRCLLTWSDHADTRDSQRCS